MDAQKNITIESCDRGEFEAKVEKLAKRAVKLGLNPPVAKLVNTREVKRFSTVGYGFEYVVELLDYVVDYPVVEVAGYTLVGRIDYDPIVVNVKPGADVDLSAYRNDKAHCDHCGYSRKRKETFILQAEDGSFIQVGKSCLKDFLGREVNGVYSFAMDCNFSDDEYNPAANSTQYHSTDALLAVTCAAIKTFGWVSTSQAREWDKRSTRADVTMALHLLDEGKMQKLVSDFGPDFVEKIDFETAKKVIEWSQDQGGSEYMENLKSVLSLGHVKPKHYGIAVSGVSAYLRAMERAQELRLAKKESNWVGAPGDKFGRKLTAADKRKGISSHDALELTVTGLNYTDGNYGITTIVRFVDDSGNRFTWFASGDLEPNVGSKFTVKATLKKHAEWKGIKSNVLQRCEMKELNND